MSSKDVVTIQTPYKHGLCVTIQNSPSCHFTKNPYMKPVISHKAYSDLHPLDNAHAERTKKAEVFRRLPLCY